MHFSLFVKVDPQHIALVPCTFQQLLPVVSSLTIS